MLTKPWIIPLVSDPLFIGKSDSLGPAVKFGGFGTQLPAGSPANCALRALTFARPTALHASTILCALFPAGLEAVASETVAGGVAKSVLPTEYRCPS